MTDDCSAAVPDLALPPASVPGDEPQGPELPGVPATHDSSPALQAPPDECTADEKPKVLDPLFTTAAAIMASTPSETEWVVKPFIPAGAITLIDGQPKAAGKTTLVMGMVASVLEGGSFLGESSKKSPVVYATEERAGTFRHSLTRAGIDSPDLHVVFFTDIRKLQFAAVVNRLLAVATATGAKVVVIDTLARFAPGVDGTPSQVSEVFEELGRVAAAGIAVIVTRHTRKSGGPVGISGRGSAAVAGAADVIIAVERPKGHTGSVRLLRTLSRFDETPSEMAVQISNGVYTVVDGFTDIPMDHEATVLEALPDEPEDAVTVAEVLEVTELKKTVGRDVLTWVVQVGKAAQIGTGVRHDPFRFYRLTA